MLFRSRPEGTRWYADTTREPIRDETLRFGLVDVGAVGKIPGVAVTSSLPIYFLKADFAAIFNPDLDETALEKVITAWQKKHLTAAARARMALLAAGKLKSDDEVLVNCPDGTVAKLSPGPSSIISKAVVEQFASSFLTAPALLWLSESGAKVRYQDQKTAKALGLDIDQSKVLPDIILANVGDTGEDTHLVFVETDRQPAAGGQDDLVGAVGDPGFNQFIVFRQVHGIDSHPTGIGECRQCRLLDRSLFRGHHDVVLIVELLDRHKGRDRFTLSQLQ